MSMSGTEAIRRYESISDEAKVRLLGRLCYDFTIEFRYMTSEPMLTQTQLEQLQGINEIQPKTLSQLLAHQTGNSQRYSDNGFFTILLDMSERYGIRSVQQSLIRELERVG